MKNGFLANATNFTDMAVKPVPDGYPCSAANAQLCPLCKGYGGWILKLNAYPLPKGYEDTAENRAKYVHFRAHCGQCNGWGWVEKDGADANCIHEYKELSQATARSKGHLHFGMCYHVYECTKCHRTMAQDSSG